MQVTNETVTVTPGDDLSCAIPDIIRDVREAELGSLVQHFEASPEGVEYTTILTDWPEVLSRIKDTLAESDDYPTVPNDPDMFVLNSSVVLAAEDTTTIEIEVVK